MLHFVQVNKSKLIDQKTTKTKSEKTYDKNTQTTRGQSA